jgi:hypothetical protein
MFFVPNFVKTNNGGWPQKPPHVKYSGSVLCPCLLMFSGLEIISLKIAVLKTVSSEYSPLAGLKSVCVFFMICVR